jgi:Protein of unknown function (DUF5672)
LHFWMSRGHQKRVSSTYLLILISILAFISGCLVVILLLPECSMSWFYTRNENLKSVLDTTPSISPSNNAFPLKAASTIFEGVAMNVVTDPPLFPDNFAALIHNYNSNLPLNWTIQLFTTTQTHLRLQSMPGLMRLVNVGRVSLHPVSATLDALSKRQILLSPWLWQNLHADKVLVFDLSSALCGNSPWTVRDFMDYDWVGAAWKWAKPGLAHVWGGNGAFSLRNRTLVLRVLNEQITEQQKLFELGNAGGSAETRFAMVKKNDDMWFVQKLFDMRLYEEGRGRKDVVRLAPREISMKWAVEELFDEDEPTPLGVYHTMRSVPDALRGTFIKRCPEAKRLFDAKHEKVPGPGG